MLISAKLVRQRDFSNQNLRQIISHLTQIFLFTIFCLYAKKTFAYAYNPKLFAYKLVFYMYMYMFSFVHAPNLAFTFYALELKFGRNDINDALLFYYRPTIALQYYYFYYMCTV